MSLVYSGAEPQPSLAWTFENSNVDIVTGLTPSAQVSPGPAQLQGSAALVTNAPTSNTAVYFPGTSGNYMNLGAAGPTTFNTTTSNTFVEAWVYFNAVAGFNSRIYGRYFDPTNNGDYNIRTSGAGLGFTNGSVVVSHQTAMQTGVWTHIAFSLMTNGTANVFVNGVVNSTGGSITVAYTPAHITLIGGGPTSLTNAYIRDLRVVQGGVVPVATFTPGAAPFSYASPGYVANMGTTVFTLLGQFITYPSGKYGSSIIFRNPSTPTQTNYISYNNKFQYQVDNGFSVSSWVKIISLPSINESYAFEFNTSDGAAYISIYCGVQPSGNFFLQYYDGIDFKGLTLVNPVVLNKWYHVVCSVGSGRVDFYLDNVNKRSITYTPRGRSIITGYLGRGCDCELDDLRIYNTALTSTQVQSVYSSQGAPAPSRAMPLPKLAWDFNGTTTDYVSGLTPANYAGASANAITYVNAAIYGTGKYVQSINVYNTSNAFYTNTLQYRLPSAIGPPYSLSFWAKQNTIWVPGNGTFASLLLRNISSPVNSFAMKLPSYSVGDSSVAASVLDVNNSGSGFTQYSTGGTGKWFFVCISVLPQAATLYFWSPSYSSIQSSTVTTTSTYATCGTDIATCISGYTEGNISNQPFNGELDDLRIFDRALTSAQVQAVFNQQGVPGRGVTSKVVPTFTVSDQSQNPLTLSTYGTPATDPSSPIGGTEGSFVPAFSGTAYSFPSSVSKLNFDFCSTTSNAFMETWVFVPLTATLSSYPNILGRFPSASTAGDFDWVFGTNPVSGGKWSIGSFYINASAVRQGAAGVSNLPLGQWVHVYFGFNGGLGTYGTFYAGACTYGSTGTISTSARNVATQYLSTASIQVGRQQWETTGSLFSDFRIVNLGTNPLPYTATGYSPSALPLPIYLTGTTALLLRSVSPLTMFSGGAIQSATGGNTVQDIGGYRIHTFTTVGTSTFTPATAGNVEVLVVAGGGGGGGNNGSFYAGGGGGAGEVYYNASVAVTSSVSVTVGSGGTGGSVGSTRPGNNGDASVFGSISCNGGGGGGGGGENSAKNGGSGGGAGSKFSGVITGGASVKTAGGFGNKGGDNINGTISAAGGGGAGGAGTDGGSSGTTLVPGGPGSTLSISGSSVTYAAGGGGGARLGPYTPSDGTSNRGDGGGGAPSSSSLAVTGGAGGSGIVIVRYPLPVRLTGTPLFSQLSSAATSSAVGAFSLRAVNGSSARAVQVRPQGQFPPVAMTSNGPQTLPGYPFGGSGNYTASASSNYPGESPFYAFDKQNQANPWTCAASSFSSGQYTGAASTTIDGTPYSGEWLQISLPVGIVLTNYTIFTWSLFLNRGPKNFKIAGSNTNNGTDWVTVDTETGITNWTSAGFSFTTTSTIAYSYFRLCVNYNNGDSAYVSIAEMTLNGSNASWNTDFYADRLGNLLTAPVVGQSLANWLGGATGYVAKWYDQSGKVNDAIQNTAANQPIIQRATKGPGYSTLWPGLASTRLIYGTSSNIFDSTNYSVCVAAKRTAATATTTYYAGTNGQAVQYQNLGLGYSTDTAIRHSHYSYSNNGPSGLPAYAGAAEPIAYDYFAFSQTTNSGFREYSWRSGTNYTSGNSGLTIPLTRSGNSTIGGTNDSASFTGEIYEVLVFTQSLYDLDNTGGLITQVYQNQLGAYGT